MHGAPSEDEPERVMHYYRPLLQSGSARPRDAKTFAEGPLWFSDVEILSHKSPPLWIKAEKLPTDILDRLVRPRPDICGLSMEQPRLMGILNVTPDSFSDGGKFTGRAAAMARASEMVENGVDILDVGGESTRPGADYVPSGEEIARTEPVIAELVKTYPNTPVSIDTRKADVATKAIEAGATLFNDVSALSFDPEALDLVSEVKPFVCLMHASGDPKTMQKNPKYDNVLLDVYDYLLQRVEAAVAVGVPRDRIVVDPGIGFGKTQAHNLALLQGLSLFHTLGCPVLLGASRKKFIGEITATETPEDRATGSVAVALAALSQGVQIIRAHDITVHKQAFAMWQAMTR